MSEHVTIAMNNLKTANIRLRDVRAEGQKRLSKEARKAYDAKGGLLDVVYHETLTAHDQYMQAIKDATGYDLLELWESRGVG